MAFLKTLLYNDFIKSFSGGFYEKNLCNPSCSNDAALQLRQNTLNVVCRQQLVRGCVGRNLVGKGHLIKKGQFVEKYLLMGAGCRGVCARDRRRKLF